jgi:hypothetical protein
VAASPDVLGHGQQYIHRDLRAAQASPMTDAASPLARTVATITTMSAPLSSSLSRMSVPSARRSLASAVSRPGPLAGTAASKARK